MGFRPITDAEIIDERPGRTGGRGFRPLAESPEAPAPRPNDIGEIVRASQQPADVSRETSRGIEDYARDALSFLARGVRDTVFPAYNLYAQGVRDRLKGRFGVMADGITPADVERADRALLEAPKAPPSIGPASNGFVPAGSSTVMRELPGATRRLFAAGGLGAIRGGADIASGVGVPGADAVATRAAEAMDRLNRAGRQAEASLPVPVRGVTPNRVSRVLDELADPIAQLNAGGQAVSIAPSILLSVLARSPSPALATIAGQVGPAEYSRYRDEGLSPMLAAIGAGLQTGAEIAPEALVLRQVLRAPIGQLIRGTPAQMREAATYLGKVAGTELGSEELSTALNWMVDRGLADPNATFESLVQQLGETAKQMAYQGPAMAATGRAARAVPDAARRVEEIIAPGRAVARALEEDVQSTDLRGSSPLMSELRRAVNEQRPVSPPAAAAAPARAGVEQLPAQPRPAPASQEPPRRVTPVDELDDADIPEDAILDLVYPEAGERAFLGQRVTAEEVAGEGGEEGARKGGRYRISPSRYAKGMALVQTPSTDDFATRAARLARALARDRYSGRERGYIMSAAAAKRFRDLYEKGADGGFMDNEIRMPEKAALGQRDLATSSQRQRDRLMVDLAALRSRENDAPTRAERMELRREGDALQAEIDELDPNTAGRKFLGQAEMSLDYYEPFKKATGKYPWEMPFEQFFKFTSGKLASAQPGKPRDWYRKVIQNEWDKAKRFGGGRAFLGQEEPSTIPDAELEAAVRRVLDYAIQDQPEFETWMNELGSEFGALPIVAPVKGLPRALEKARGDYEGTATQRAAQLKDLNRGTLIVDTADTIPGIMDAIRARANAVKLLNLYEKKLPANDPGYRGAMVVVKTPGGHREVQINTPEMIRAKEVAHQLYEWQAEIVRRAKRENRAATAEEQKVYDLLSRRMRVIYDGALLENRRRVSMGQQMNQQDLQAAGQRAFQRGREEMAVERERWATILSKVGLSIGKSEVGSGSREMRLPPGTSNERTIKSSDTSTGTPSTSQKAGITDSIPRQMMGQRAAPDVTQTAAFKKWFGDSKVVDKDGKPLVVYHGSRNADWLEAADGATFFTTDKKVADDYAGNKAARGFYLSAKKLLDLTNPYAQENRAFLKDYREEFDEWTDRASGEPLDPADFIESGTLYDYEGTGSGRRWTRLFELARLQGYDGVKINDVTIGTRHPTYVVFKAEQIKSAIGNRGTFDPKSKSILADEEVSARVMIPATAVLPIEKIEGKPPFKAPSPVAIGMNSLVERAFVHQLEGGFAEVVDAVIRTSMQYGLTQELIESVDGFVRFDGQLSDSIALYWPSLNIIGFRTDLLTEARNNPRRIATLVNSLAHEFSHGVDNGESRADQRELPSSKSPRLSMTAKVEKDARGNVTYSMTELGDLSNEVVEAMRNPLLRFSLGRFFRYPMDSFIVGDMDAAVAKAELVAQVGALYLTRPALVRKYLPLWFEVMEKTYGSPEKDGGIPAPRSIAEAHERLQREIQKQGAGEQGEARVGGRGFRPIASVRDRSGAPRGPPESGVGEGAEERRRAAQGQGAGRDAGRPVTETAAFKRWFGDSKVVDADGRPLVVYHGTKADVERFRLRVGDIGVHFGTRGQANDRMDYLRDRREFVDVDGENIIPVYLRVQRPLRLTDAGLWNADNLAYQLKEKFPNDAEKIARLRSTKDVREFIQSKGFDGVVYRNTGEVGGARPYQQEQDRARKAMVESQKRRGKPVNAYDAEDQETPEYKAYQDAYTRQAAFREKFAEDSFIVFDASQIKSAIGNRGTFDPKRRSILEQISPEQARSIDMETNLPSDPVFARAVENTPGAEITDDGLLIDLVRFQKRSQEGDESVRTGVFYLPAKSGDARHYRNSKTGYGGESRVRGQTLLRAPIFVKGATGGAAPEQAYIQIKGKEAFKEMQSHVTRVITKGGNYIYPDPKLQRQLVEEFLDQYAPEQTVNAPKILDVSKAGNTLRYALQELAIATAVREAGYDSVVGHSFRRASREPFLTEVFDVRETHYPIQGEDGEVHDSFPMKPRAALGQAQAANPYWDYDEPGLIDALRREWQDNKIDLKHVQKKIEEFGGVVQDDTNAYLAEERYHGRVTSRLRKFFKNAVEPMLKEIKDSGVTVDEVSRYLWARHAKERNAQMAKINPGGPANLSGLYNDAAAAAAAGQPRAANAGDIMNEFARQRKLTALASVAKRVDAITKATRQVLISEGLESAKTIKAWEDAYKFYVPLFRDTDEVRTGQGFTIKGAESRRAMGSQREAVAILAAVIAQHERAIIRAEKAEVGRTLIRLAEQFPNTDFWRVDTPPTKRSINPTTGLVQNTIDPLYKQRDDVFIVKEQTPAGDVVERVIAFNPESERAMKLAAAMKNLDVVQLGAFTKAIGRVTRLMANMATSWNPVFWTTNFARDVQTAAVNLQNTPLRGKAPQVMSNIPNAIAGIMDAEFRNGTGRWAKLYREFEDEGGKTGWMTLFDDLIDRQKALESEIKASQRGNINPLKWGAETIEVIDKINSAIENATRLSAFAEARQQGLSPRQAASLAKNLTVNFNRKGNRSSATNAWYMFFNASVQGTARLIQAVAKSRRAQAMVGTMVAFSAAMELVNRIVGDRDRDEDENNPYELIPEHVKQKNMIFMLPGNRHVMIPLPYGFNVFHNAGRMMMEGVLSASNSDLVDEKKKPLEAAWNFAETLIDSFMPLGQSTTPGQFIAPSLLDPFVQFGENKTWYGAPMRPEPLPFGGGNVPDHQKYFRTTSELAKDITKFLSDATGGDSIKGGAIDISPTTLTHIFGTLTGGTGRFGLGMFDFTKHIVDRMTGDAEPEDLPMKAVPFVGKFYGEVTDREKAGKFYRLRNEAAQVLKEVANYRRAGEDEKADALEDRHPELVAMGREIASRSFKREMKGLRDQFEELGQMDRSERARVKRQLQREEADIMSRALRAYNEELRGR